MISAHRHLNFAWSESLDGLRELALSDLPIYKRAIASGQQLGFGYYFPGLLAYRQPGKRTVLIKEQDGSICVFRCRAAKESGKVPRLDVLFPPMPFNPSVLKDCLELANEHNGDRSARVLRIDSMDADAVDSLSGLRVAERKLQYLYSPESFADISGREYRSIRRNIAKVTALKHVEVLPYSSVHLEGCQSLIRKWRKNHREKHKTLGGIGTTKRVIELTADFKEADLCGQVITINDKLVAFAFGGEIRPGVAAFFEAKADFEVQGLTYFQRYCFMSQMSDVRLINDGSDAGRPGLRQLKNRLRPVALHSEFRGYQKAG